MSTNATASIWTWLLSRLGLGRPKRTPQARNRPPRPSTPPVGPTHATLRPLAPPRGKPPEQDLEIDWLEGCEYPPEAVVSLDDQQREQAERLAAAIRRRFDAAAIEEQPFPNRRSQIFAMLEDPEFEIERLIVLTQRDPMLSAAVLRVASSAAYSSLQEVEGVRDAILRLGAQTVASIAATLSTRGLFEGGARSARGVVRELWEELWLHSVTAAFASGAISLSMRKGNLEHCFLGGMLHDLGKTFALREALAAWGELGEPQDPGKAVLVEAIEAVHVELGIVAAEAWKLPDYLATTCATHHETGFVDLRASSDSSRLRRRPRSDEVSLVGLASGMAALHLTPLHRRGLVAEVMLTGKALGLDGYHLRAYRTEVRTGLAKARAL